MDILNNFWHIVLKGPEWTIQARIKIHNKPITDLIFGTFTNNKFGSNSDLFSIGLDRKICRIANNALSLRKNVDKNSDPLVISYFQGQVHHIFSLFLNVPINKFYPQNFLCFFSIQVRSFLWRSKMPI
jgi:vacuolar-type H+-ATPase subunit I/STV1